MNKNKTLDDLYNPELFREIGHQLIDEIADQLSSSLHQKTPVNKFQHPDQNFAKWNTFLDTNPDLNTLFRAVFEDAIKLHNPNYMGHQVSVPSPLAAFGGLISDILNNGMAVYEMGAAANVLERKTIEIINEAIGYDQNSSGFLTSGGTLANLTALLTARRIKAEEDIWNDGYQDSKYAVMVSEQAHYCIDRAVRIMGMGSKGIIKIPVNDSFQMRTDLLDYHYLKAKEEGIKIFAVIGSSCSTSTGAYDDLRAIADFAKEKNLWFHVDGAHGGAVIFSNKYKSLVNGIEQADSVIIDCHKMMMSPTLSTAVLYKRIRDSFATFQQKAEYLYSEKEDLNWYDTGKRTFECTKLMMSLKFMIIYQQGGHAALQSYVETLYEKAQIFAAMILKDPSFELATDPQANILCFRYRNPELDEEALNKLNQKIRTLILEEGQFYIVQTTLNSKLFLRTTIMNPYTDEYIFAALLEDIKTKAANY